MLYLLSHRIVSPRTVHYSLYEWFTSHLSPATTNQPTNPTLNYPTALPGNPKMARRQQLHNTTTLSAASCRCSTTTATTGPIYSSLHSSNNQSNNHFEETTLREPTSVAAAGRTSQMLLRLMNRIVVLYRTASTVFNAGDQLLTPRFNL